MSKVERSFGCCSKWGECIKYIECCLETEGLDKGDCAYYNRVLPPQRRYKKLIRYLNSKGFIKGHGTTKRGYNRAKDITRELGKNKTFLLIQTALSLDDIKGENTLRTCEIMSKFGFDK